MRILKKTIFWAHLVAGLSAGLVILVLAVTGVIMTYERQIIEWSDGLKVSQTGDGALGIETLLASQMGAQPAPSAILVANDPEKPAAVSFGRTKTVFLDPYTGESLGEGNTKVRGFFKWVVSLHRWLTLEGPARDLGKNVTGIGNLVFLFLVISGLWLWFPRRWTRSNLRAITKLQGRLKGRARDWNWHNVFGFWACLPLFFIVITGAIMSYPWATALVYRAVGETPPAPRGQGGGGGGARPATASNERAGGGQRGGGERRERAAGGERGGMARGERAGGGGARQDEHDHDHGPEDLVGLDTGLALVKEANPGWKTIRVDVPHVGKPVVYNVAYSHRGRPDLAKQVTVDLVAAKVVKTEGFEKQTLGRKLRTFTRWVHTGEAGGWIGQGVAGLSAASAAVLVWTGFALSFRRFFKRRKKNQAGAVA